VVLLDEPFSNLDVEVRLRLRSELPGVLSQCGACGLIVTHDPEEALAICDRVAVLEQGVLHQIASPRELVEQPASAFVGRFVLQANLLPAVAGANGQLHTAIGAWRLADSSAGPAVGAELQLLVSPEALQLLPDAGGEAWVLGREFLGREWLYQVQLSEQRLRLRLPLDHDWSRGQRCQVQLRSGAKGLLYPDRLVVQAL
jgi:iron(III) transport system ATP-binding protein